MKLIDSSIYKIFEFILNNKELIYNTWTKIDNGVYIKQDNESYLLTIPFYFINSDNALTFSIKTLSNNEFVINDLGATYDYLEQENDVVSIYDKLIDKIVSRFNVYRLNRILSTTLPPLSTNQTIKFFYRFLQCLSIISNIDLFSIKSINLNKKKFFSDDINILTSQNHTDIYKTYLSKAKKLLSLPYIIVNPLFFKEIALELNMSLEDVYEIAFFKKYVEIFNNEYFISSSFVTNSFEGAKALLKIYELKKIIPNPTYFLESIYVPDTNKLEKLSQDLEMLIFNIKSYRVDIPNVLIRNNRTLIQKSIYCLMTNYIRYYIINK